MCDVDRNMYSRFKYDLVKIYLYNHEIVTNTKHWLNEQGKEVLYSKICDVFSRIHFKRPLLWC